MALVVHLSVRGRVLAKGCFHGLELCLEMSCSGHLDKSWLWMRDTKRVVLLMILIVVVDRCCWVGEGEARVLEFMLVKVRQTRL